MSQPRKGDETFAFYTAPKVVGWMVIFPGPFCTQISVSKKPNWLHRTVMRLLLGWEWKDA